MPISVPEVLFYVGCDGTEKSRQKSNQIGQFANARMAHAASFISVNWVVESKTQKEPTWMSRFSLKTPSCIENSGIV